MRCTIDDYRAALEGASVRSKDKTLDAAAKDPEVDCFQFRELERLAYPEEAC